MNRVSSFEVRFAPVAWLVGLGLAGFGVAGIRGAGAALMIPATLVFVGALIDGRQGSALRARRKKTLRHRWFLWLDRLDRGRADARYERRRRKEAEQSFLDGRRERKER